jgi:hypothetical protein
MCKFVRNREPLPIRVLAEVDGNSDNLTRSDKSAGNITRKRGFEEHQSLIYRNSLDRYRRVLNLVL